MVLVSCGIYFGLMKLVVLMLCRLVVDRWLISLILLVVDINCFLFCRLLCGLILIMWM